MQQQRQMCQDGDNPSIAASEVLVSPNLHDCLALGDVEVGLQQQSSSLMMMNDDDNNDDDEALLVEQQRHRLPILLRLLAASRPHASIPSFEGWNVLVNNNNDQQHDADVDTGNNKIHTSKASPLSSSLSSSSPDALVDHVVCQLEDMAATHSGAEAMDVITLSVVPTITRKLSRVPPLRRRRQQGQRHQAGRNSKVLWDTHELALFHATNCSATSVVSNDTKQAAPQTTHNRPPPHHHPLKRQSSELVLTDRHQLSDDDDNYDDDAEFDDDDPMDEGGDHDDAAAAANQSAMDDVEAAGDTASKKRKSSSKTKSKNNRQPSSSYRMRESENRQKKLSEDSPEALVTSTMAELVSLVLNFLEQEQQNEDDYDERTKDKKKNKTSDEDDDDDDPTTTHVTGGPSVGSRLESVATTTAATSTVNNSSSSHQLLQDLVLSSQSSDAGISAMASILHHAPVLRYEHVANALCRTGVPRVATLIARLAANCPTAVPSLLRGCINACHVQPKVSKAALLAIAYLSPRETSRVLVTLQQLQLQQQRQQQQQAEGDSTVVPFWDVQLELAMKANMPVVVANLLIQQFSTSILTLLSRGTTPHVNNQNHGEDEDAAVAAVDRSDAGAAENDMLTDFSEKNLLTSRNNASHHRTIDGSSVHAHILLLADPKLQQRTIQYLYHQLVSIASAKSNVVCWGQVCLYLSAYSWFQFCMACGSSLQQQQGSSALVPSFGDLVNMLKKFLQQVIQESNRSSRGFSRLDRCYRLIVGASVVTLGRYLAMSTSNTDTSNGALSADDVMEARRMIKDILLQDVMPSRASQVFLARLAWLIQHSLIHELCDLILVDAIHFLSNRSASNYSSYTCNTFPNIAQGILFLCDLVAKDENNNLNYLQPVWRRGVEMECLKVDLSAFALFLLGSTANTVPQADIIFVTESTKEFLQRLLNDPDLCKSFIQKDGAKEVIIHGTTCVTRSGLSQVPLILPLQIERLVGRVDLNNLLSLGSESASSALGPVECQFLMQLLYCFAFQELNPASPFSFDPRALPLKEVLFLCDEPPNSAVAVSITRFLRQHICKVAPEVGARLDRWKVPSHPSILKWQHETPTVTDHRHVLIGKLSSAIRESCSSENSLDPDGTMAEQIFSFAERHLADTVLHETVVSSLFAVRHSPLSRISYSQLCRDPLVLLKLPLRVWKCSGLKRTTLTVLSNLLETNAELIREACKSNDVALEMLAARNSVLARCLLSTVGDTVGKEKHSQVHSIFCLFLNSFLRRLIAETSGIVGVLVKENLPDVTTDWLIEFIPETILDWQSLAALLTDRCSLTAAERLLAADSVLRIAIAHGQTCEEEAQSLAFAALTLLVSSFFLVVGPVGVPVNALLVDDNSLDVMQASRKATIRMLRSLPHVRGRRSQLRDECGMALQKLAGLCKGEATVGGFPGAVAGGRKAVLKEIYDSITKAANAMGSTVQI